MIVANAASRDHPRSALAQVGYQCSDVADPYTAMVELCRRPLVYRALVLSLNSLFQEELALIEAVKRRFPHIEVWLTDLEGRQAALAEALRLGADGLLSDGRLHRIATGPRLEAPAPPSPPPAPLASPVTDAAAHQMTLRQSPMESDDTALHRDGGAGDPVLTADELRALLQDPDMEDAPETGRS